MPLKLDVVRKFTTKSDRVKCVDFHPTEPWILACCYNGHVYIYNYKTNACLKSIEASDLPIRTGKFIARKSWIIIGADDMTISVWNYNTMEKVKSFEAHSDYIRSIAVHPTQPFILSSSDDLQIKLWDWDKNWKNIQTFEGHNHYVMQVTFNPKDPNTFASASLDRTIKIWSLGSPTPNFTLEGHEKGVNCVDYFQGGEKPYLISGADDKTVKVWDYQSKSCVQTLEGHSHNVSVVCYHPTLPIIISGSEDCSVKIWHSNTYRMEKNLNYGMERVWALSYLKGSNKVAMGFDDGISMIKLGSEEPAASMDSTGKIVFTKHNEIHSADVRNSKKISEVEDGEKLNLPVKELGSCEIFPQSVKHNSNGHFIVVCGDGEYIIYTTVELRNRSYGPGLEFVWDTRKTKNSKSTYAVKESSTRVKVFSNFKESHKLSLPHSCEGIFAGPILGVKSTKSICFYSWAAPSLLIRKIDASPKSVVWSESGEYVAICCDTSFYVLKFNEELVEASLASESETDIEGAFELLHELPERVKGGVWAGDCFVYVNGSNRLNYCVGGEVFTISHLDRQMYLLGYVPRDNRLYFIDRDLNITRYTLHLSVVNYQTAILRGNLELAESLLPNIPTDQRDKIAHFLESQGLREEALRVTTELDHKFDLAIQLGNLQLAHSIAKESDSQHKWRQLSDLALMNGEFDLAEECMWSAEDINGLLLLYTSLSHAEGIARLAAKAKEQNKNNTAFICYYLLGDVNSCLQLLVQTGRISEAAFLARTFAPSQVSKIVKEWKEDLQKVNPRAAESLADPVEYENLFPDFMQYALRGEEILNGERAIKRGAESYLDLKRELTERNIIAELKAADEDEEGAEEEGQRSPTQN
eukprot:TRINITY_DN4844_c0_g2_i1.p1 TRINITY_DN4844_c0_g2~~TRINITY_DN4844_c0_g2_i1.p1  ORF type:complete len:867 (-),score=183.19 TRINITY_DN4844_c0_g2_i1:46-2646(-)